MFLQNYFPAIFAYDERVFRFFEKLAPNRVFFELMSFFSFIGNYGIIWFFLLILVVYFAENKNRLDKFTITFSLALSTSAILNAILKTIIARPRPFDQLLETSWIFYQKISPSGSSFPSLHATLAFTSCVLLSSRLKKFQKYFYLGAILTSFSRIYLGVHFVSDVVVGALLGFVIGYLALEIESHWVPQAPKTGNE